MHTSSIEILEARIAPATAKLVSLGSLTGANGFTIPGLNGSDGLGHGVSSAGDVNGDGYEDFIVTVPRQTEGDQSHAGGAYVVFGKAGGFPAKLDLTSLDGTNGFKLDGSTAYAYAGISASGAGDINGDGFDDIVVGESFSSNVDTNSGSAYVIFGKADGFAATIQLSALSGTDGFRIDGAHAGDRLGSAVSGVGDINGDGIDDLAVGAPFARPHGYASGAVYVIFGNKTTPFSATFNVSTLNGTNGFTLNGDVINAYAGFGLAKGDINGDGISDMVIESGNLAQGRIFVVYGHTGAQPATVELSGINSSTGFRVYGESVEDNFGISLAVGDINGDGFDDILAGANNYPYYGTSATSQEGAAYVIFGGTTHSDLTVDTLNGANGFKLDGHKSFDEAGVGVALGDINGDGFADIIVGAPGAKGIKTYTGVVYVMYGSDGPFAAETPLESIDSTQGFKISGGKTGDYAGYSVSAIGDFNGDGFDDLVIGASHANKDKGAVDVLFGGPGSISAHSFSFTDVDGDLVKVATTKGKLDRSDFTLVPEGQGYQLESIDFHGDPQFNKTNLTITAKTPKGGTGDGLVNVETIDASNLELGQVKVSGNLGKIIASAPIADLHGHRDFALKSLTVGSLGEEAAIMGTSDDYHSVLNGAVGSITVRGDVRDVWLAVLGQGSKLGKVTIGGNLDGSDGGTHSGLIMTDDDSIGSVTVKGSIIGGADFSGIISGVTLGKVSIGHDLTSADPSEPVTISAYGNLLPMKQKNAMAIAGVTITGNVLNAEIFAGYDVNLFAGNADAGIGAVLVKGNWSASNLAAGVKDATNDGFGRNDTLIPGGDAAIIARLASITIKGTATGSPAAGDFFGITAEQIGKFTLGKTKETLSKTGADDLSLDDTNGDFHAVDFAVGS